MLATRRPPSRLNGWHGEARLFGYLAEVQPVFTRHCVGCHDYGKKGAAKLILSPDRTIPFNTSYTELWRKGYVRADGKVRPWDRSKGRRPDRIDPDTLGRICRGSPSVLFLAAGKGKAVKPAPEAEPVLHYRHVELRRLPEAEAIDAYNACRDTKAILLPLGG